MKQMLKKTLSLVLVLATLFALTATMSLGAAADDPVLPVNLGKAGPNIDVIYDESTKTLTLLGDGEMTNYFSEDSRLPTDIKARPWDSLTTTIEKVVVGTGITSIGSGAFYGLTACTSYSFPSTLTTIGELGLAGNKKLNSVIIPASVTYVGKFAFYNTSLNADGLKNSQLLGSATRIEASYGNSTLLADLDAASYARAIFEAEGSVNNPDGVTSSDIRWSYTSTTKTLTLTNTSAVAVEIPTINGNGPWSTYNDSITTIVVGDNITGIGKYAFQGMTKVNTVRLGQHVAAIRSSAFAGCTALKTLQLPAATLTIEASAFDSRETGNTIALSTPNSQAYMTQYGSISENGNSLVTWTYGSTYTPPTVTPPTTSDKNGFINNQIRWDYSASSGLLTLSLVSGVTSASIPDYPFYTYTPWAQAGLSNTITSLSIGSGITGIGDYAFANLTMLSNVSIGQSVQVIGSYAFAYAAQLPNVILPNSVTLVEPYAFYGCTKLGGTYGLAYKYNASAVIQTPNPELLNALSNYIISTGGGNGNGNGTGTGTTVENVISGTSLTWSYNSATKSLNIRGTGDIPNYTAATAVPWYGYASEIEAISVQSGVTSIGNYAFYGCSKLVDLYLPATVSNIGAYAFSNCTSLKTMELPSGVQLIGEYAFFNCTALKEVTLNNNLKQIGAGAFYGCTALTFVDFPALLQLVGERAFYGCTALTGVVIRSSTMMIGSNAFYGCSQLSKAVCYGSQPVANVGNEALTTKYVSRYGTGSNANVSWDIDRATGVMNVTVIDGSGAVVNATGWKDELLFADTVTFNGATTIGASLLKGNTQVKNIVLSDTVQTIGVSAFEGCTALKGVTFSKNLTTMGSRAFYGCTALTDVVLPDAMAVIADEAFAASTALTSVTLGKNTSTIGTKAFAGCSALKELELPTSVVTLSTGAFADCYTLSKLTLSAGAMATIPANTFTGCTSLRSIYFNGSTTQWASLSANADTVIKAAVVTYCTTVTIYYEYEGGPLNGQTVAAAESFTGAMGTAKVVTLPTVDHYAPDTPTMSITFGTTNASYYVKYKPKTYTVTLNFVDDVTGMQVAESKVYQIQYLGTLSTPAFSLTGYTLQENPVVITNVSADMTKEVKCTRMSYTYTVEYVNERTGKVFETATATAKYGEKAVHTPKTIAGYTVKNASQEYSITVTGNDQKITVPYTPAQKTLTISYVDKDGTKLADDKTMSVYYGDPVSVDSPAVTGKTPDKATVEMEAYAGEDKVTVTYDWTVYTLTVHFVEKDASGYKIYEDFTTQVKHGDAYTFKLADQTAYATPAGYVTDVVELSFGTVTQDAEKTITYSRKNLTLTVNYTDAQGNVLDTVLVTVPAGTVYTVDAKEIEGYLAAESFAHQMGTEDETVTVQMQIDPNAPVKTGNVGKVILVVVVILLVLVTGGALFYFLYLKKKPQW